MSRDLFASKNPAAGQIRKFKGSTVFEWDTEPAQERPSDFAESGPDTGMWGPGSHTAYVALETRRSRPTTPRRGSGSRTLLTAFLMVALIATTGILGLTRLL